MNRLNFLSPALAVLVAFVLAVGSCGGEKGEKKTAESWEIDEKYSRGPVDLRVAVSRKEITIADRLSMLIETRARDGYSAELPRFGEKLEQFGIVDYTSPSSRLEEDGTVVTSRVYELEPFLSGSYRIPPMTVAFSQEGDSLVHTVESDTLVVEVLSLLPEDQAELELKGIAGPVPIPADRRLLYLIAGIFVVAAAAAWAAVFFRKKREAPVRAVPAHEIAFERLERLLAEGLIDQKRYVEFTERVSDILRHYIEDRFGLRAPERTTEEFIIEAGEGLAVEPERKDILKDFMIHCDLVKFAAHEPTGEEVKRTFDTCRDFIDGTMKVEEVEGEAA